MCRVIFALLSLLSISGWPNDLVPGRGGVLEKVKPVGLPDLTVSALTEPRYLGGGSYVVDVTVRNIARGSSPASTVFFWDIQMQHGQRKQVGPLVGRGSAIVSFNLGAPENQGPFYYSASADYGNSVRETSETNNQSTFRE